MRHAAHVKPPSGACLHAISRRDFLWQAGGGLGGIAAGRRLLAARGRSSADGGLRTTAPKAKRVVQLFMAGAASHIDLFDYKPELIKRARRDVRLRRARSRCSRTASAPGCRPLVGLQAVRPVRQDG